MNIGVNEISIAHIHAYVDAQLDDDDCALVEDYIDAHPEKFEELQQYLAMNEHYQTLFGSLSEVAVTAQMPMRLRDDSLTLFSPSFRGVWYVLSQLNDALFDKRFNLPRMLANVSNSVRSLKRSVILRLGVNLLEEKPWNSQVNGKVPGRWRSVQNTLTVGIRELVNKLRLHPQTASPWLMKIAGAVSVLKTKMVNSYTDLNLFAVLSIAVTGIVLGVIWQRDGEVPDSDVIAGGGMELLAMQAQLFPAREKSAAAPVVDDDGHLLLSWISYRIGQNVRLIDLSDKGYRYQGVMLIPSAADYALVSVYTNTKMEKLTLLVGPGETDKTQNLRCKASSNATELCTWVRNKLQFVIVSNSTALQTKQISRWLMYNYSTARVVSGDL